MTQDYNKTNKPDTQAPKKDAVVSKPAKKVKRGLIERAVIAMVGPDGVRAVGTYVAHEVILPAVKNIIADSVTSGVNRMMFPDGSRSGRRSSYNRATGYGGGNTQRTAYNRPGPRDDYAPSEGRSRPRRFESTDFMINDRNEAESVIDSLVDSLQSYNQASVADFYELIDVPTEFTDNNWGWKDLSTASVRPYHEGWVIVLPKPVQL